MPNRLKELMLRETTEHLRELRNLVLVSYHGINAGTSGALRRDLRDRKMTLRVVRNRITVKALSELGNAKLGALIRGQTAVLGGDDPVLTARAAVECAERASKLEIRGGFVDGEVFSTEKIREIARWPCRTEILAGIAAMVLGTAGRPLSAALSPGSAIAGAVKSRAGKLEKEEPPPAA